jgi:hypothetical protein
MPSRRFALALPFRVAAALTLAALLAACAETDSGGGLAPGLVASMDAPGASLDRPTAFGVLNQYRSTTGAGPLADDPSLDATAQNLAKTYSTSDKAPALPAGVTGLRASAGYANFAETFSGWRNTPGDAAVLAATGARRAGLAAVYDANSTYGVYWILVLAG